MELDTGQLFLQIIKLLKGHELLLAAPLIITVLTRIVGAIAQKAKPDWLPNWVLPIVSAFLGCCGTMVAAVIEGASWFTGAVLGFIVGTSATGFWELVVKYIPVIRKKKVEEKAPPPAEPAGSGAGSGAGGGA